MFFCLKDKVCTVAPEGDWRVEDKSKDYVSQASKSSVVNLKYQKKKKKRIWGVKLNTSVSCLSLKSFLPQHSHS